jgi:hypothetical protein
MGLVVFPLDFVRRIMSKALTPAASLIWCWRVSTKRMKRMYSEVRSLWLRLQGASSSVVRMFILPGLLLCSTMPAAAVFKADLEANNFGSTNWSTGPISGWRELDVITCRVLFTGGPQSNYVVTINFDHSKGTSRGIEDLTGFLPSTNVIINSGPTLSAPAGVDIWSYTLNVTVTNAAPAYILYGATLSAGAHNFGGASLAMGGVAQLQIQKPTATFGSPDMALTKVGATQARTNQILTYVITYTNKLVAADAATGVQVIDTLPPQVSYVPGSGSKGVKVLGNTLTWNLGNLPLGKSGFLTYKVLVTNNIPVTTTFANYAQILGSQNDANPGDNAAFVNTTVVVIPTPLAADDNYTVGKNQTLTIPSPGVLLNDSNAVSASLLALPANGSLTTFNTNGSFTYVPGTNFIGSDSFAYRSLNSSNMSGPAIVTIDVTNTCFLIGTVNTITNNDPGQCGAVVNFALPITTGDCAPLVFSPTNGSFFPIGTNTVTFTNTDGVTNSFQVIVLDTELPTLGCPGDMIFAADAGQCSRNNVTFSVTSGDNCSASILQVSGLPSGSTFPIGTTTNRFVVTDASGNTASCSFTVTVNDNNGPVIACPANIVIEALAGQCTSNVTFSVTASDVCGSVTNLVSVPASGSAFPVGATTVTSTATDNSGNTTICTFTVTVVDLQPPTLTCPAPVNIAANNGLCAATNVSLGTPIAGDNCSAVSITNNAPASFPVGTNLVTWTASDTSGNTVTCQQLVIVRDTQLPVISCPTDVTVDASAGSCSASGVVLGSPTATDNCGAVTVTNNAPAQFSVGTNVVTWTATDSSGNTALCQQRVIVRDIQPPTINCPTSLVLEADPGQCSRSNVTWTVTALDNCGAVSVVSIPPSGSSFPLGTTTVTNIATDASGNQTICTFTVNAFSVTINDTEPPVINCPTNLVLMADPGQCTRSNVTFLVTATDNCTVTNLLSFPASGSTFPVGVTTVTNIATDAGGNQALCTFTVTVRDNQGPVLACPANIVVNATAGQCASNVTFNVTASDACGSVTNLVSVPSSGSIFPVGVTTVTNTATDNSGNTTTCTFTVTVRDNQGPVLTCPANLVVNAATGQCTSNVIFNVTAADVCGSVTNLVSAPASGSTFPVGVTTVTNTATDNSGNTSVCTFTVTVRDNQGPVLTCPADVVVNASAGQCASNVTFSVTASDACGSLTNLVSVPASGSAFPVGTTTVTNTATDNSGNTSICTFTVTVRDNQGPVLTCPADVVVNAAAGQCASNVTFNVTATDACGSVTNLVSVPASGSAFPVGVTTVTNTATDNSGNTSVCTFTVTVRDNQGPVLTCPPNIVVNAAAGQCASNVTFNVTASDACGSVTNLASVPASGSAFPVGVTTVTNTATDNSGNASTCIFTVTVIDTQPPTITCPPDLFVIAAPGQPTTNLTFSVTANDACGSVTSLVSVPPSGYAFPVGVTTVTNTATDNSGNSSTCSFTVTVTAANRAPLANAQSISTPEDTVLSITLTGSDPDGNPLTYILASGPASGVLSGFNTNTGVVTYTPNTNFNGGDSFTFLVNDGTTNSAPALVSITVTPLNDAPVAVNDYTTTARNVPVTLFVLLNDYDVDGDTLTITAATATNGTVNILGGTNLFFTPGSNFVGIASVGYTITDGNGGFSTAPGAVTITVGTNVPPVANHDTNSTPEDIAITFDPRLNDIDPDGDPLTITLASATNGTVGILGGTNLLFTPTTNFNGTATIGYTIDDGNSGTATAVVTVIVTPVNDAPLANGQNLTTPEDTALPITLTGSDVEGTALTFILVGNPTNGLISGFNTNTGALTYSPNANYNGADSFTFRVNDGTNTSAVAVVTIIVTPVNDAPLANSQNLTTPEDTALPITLTGSDAEGASLSFVLVDAPVNGAITGFNTNTGALTYQPNTNYTGSDSFTFRTSDGTTSSALATVNLTVTPVNDAPVANNQNVITPEDTPLAIVLTGSDVEGTPLTYTLVNGPTNGSASGFNTNTGALTYTPNTNYTGSDTLTFRVSDGTNVSALASVSITVTPVNDAPIANNQSVTTPEDTALPITLTGSDVENGPLTFILVTSPANGVVSGFNTNTGSLTYRPNTNYTGSDSFTFRTSDGTNVSSAATVSITVTPLNDAPFANNQSLTTPEDTALPITLTGSDVEGAALTFILVSNPANGLISGFNTNTGTLSYSPNANYTGSDSFTFRTSDGTNTSAVATVSITVTPLNDAPIANSQNVTTPEDTALPIALVGSDLEGTPLTYILMSGPANGALSAFNTNTGALTYTPNTNYNGADSFTFRVSDGTNFSAVATVTITVIPVADQPRAVPQGLTTPEDTPLPITLIGTSPDGSPLTYQLISAPTHGAFVSFNTNSGVLTYQPHTNYNGFDAFTFRVSDGFTNSLVATVSITVTPVNDGPIVVNDSTNTPSGQLVVISPLVNDTDPDGGALAISCMSSTNGTAVVSGTNILFTSASNFVGTVNITYCATNLTGGSGSAIITVIVTPQTTPTFSLFQGSNTVNPQTGLFEQRVTITNSGVSTASAVRLLVGNINSPLGVPRTNVWLYNATGTNVDARPYVLYNAPLNPGQFVTLTLEFVVPDRRPFTNSLEAVSVLPVAGTTGTTNVGSGVMIDRSFTDNRFLPPRYVIEWASLPGRTYTVIYSDDNMATWKAATPTVSAVNTRTQWYDDGPPKTASAPFALGSRYYRVILNP